MTSIKDISAQSNLKSMQMGEFCRCAGAGAAHGEGLAVRASGSLLAAQPVSQKWNLLEYLLAE